MIIYMLWSLGHEFRYQYNQVQQNGDIYSNRQRSLEVVFFSNKPVFRRWTKVFCKNMHMGKSKIQMKTLRTVFGKDSQN